jgi:hypothetical protein
MDLRRAFTEPEVDEVKVAFVQLPVPADAIERLPGLPPVRGPDEPRLSQINLLSPYPGEATDPGNRIHFQVCLVEIQCVRASVPVGHLLTPKSDVLNLDEQLEARLEASIQTETGTH